jgi:Flp pilus assembly protein TadG
MTMLRRLLTHEHGTMAVETALVAPVLILLGLGGFQVGSMVSAQHDLETAAALGEQIALASKPDSQAKLDTMKGIISATTGVPVADISTAFIYRCGTAADVQTTNSCGTDPAWQYVEIIVSQTYNPMWVNLGVGHPVDLSVDKTVQIA